MEAGFCALVYQTAWFRSLRLVFGSSTAATAAVLAIFMAGLGWGGLRLGRRADAHPRPLAFYAALEAAIAALAALSPWLVDAIRALYLATGGTRALGFAGGTLVRLALSALVLGAPAFLMGGTLPAMARAVETAADAGRRRVGFLYGWNTLGAVAGVVATTFWLVELLGVRRTIWIAALLNLLIAVVARAWARTSDSVEPREAPESPRTPNAVSRFVSVAAFVVGFVFLLMELVWYRMLAPLLGGSTYTFGIILATALAGIGAGGLAYGVAAPRGSATRSAFAATCVAEAVLLLVPFAAGDRVADLALGLRGFAAWGFAPLVAGWAAVAAAVVLAPALVAGYQFPLLVALLGRGRERVGTELGAAYAWNTLGAIAGSLAGGFFALPVFGATGIWRGAAWLLVALALAALLTEREPDAKRSFAGAARRFAMVGLLVALALGFAPGPSAAWRHRPIGAGRVPLAGDANELQRRAAAARRAITWERDGREVALGLDTSTGDAIAMNGKSDGHALFDADTQVMGGLVGAALHPAARHALVIGFGTGSTAGWLAEVPTMERVDVVEIEPAVLEAARGCGPVSRDALSHPKVAIVIEDARELLQSSRQRYDLIFSEPSNPFRVGISSLFSAEFYASVRARLAPGGYLLQWLQGYEIDAEMVRAVYATIGSAFASVETWQVGEGDLLLVASEAPIAHDPAALAARIDAEPYRSAMAWTWGVTGAAGFYAARVAAPPFAAAVGASAAAEIERDDRPRLEFGFARWLGRAGLFSIEKLRELATRRGERALPAGAPPEEELADAQGARLLAGSAAAHDIEQATRAFPALARRGAARRALAERRSRDAVALWLAEPSPPRHPAESALLAEAMAEIGDARAAELLPALARDYPPVVELVTALAAETSGDVQRAAEAYARGFERLRDWPWLPLAMIERALLRARALGERHPAAAATLLPALERPFAVHAYDELRRRTRLELALAADYRELCGDALEPFEVDPPWEERFLRQRLGCRELHGDPRRERARRDLERFLAARPIAPSEWQLPKPAAARGR
jgi:spermidine synthase